jgi:hypothetical protein
MAVPLSARHKTKTRGVKNLKMAFQRINARAIACTSTWRRGIVIYGPADDVKQWSNWNMKEDRYSHISGLVVKASARLRALMK